MERDAAIVEVSLNETTMRAQNPQVPYSPQEARMMHGSALRPARQWCTGTRDPITGAQGPALGDSTTCSRFPASRSPIRGESLTCVIGDDIDMVAGRVAPYALDACGADRGDLLVGEIAADSRTNLWFLKWGEVGNRLQHRDLDPKATEELREFEAEWRRRR